MTAKEFLEEMANQSKLPHRFDTQDEFLAGLLEKYAEAKKEDEVMTTYIKENFTKRVVNGMNFMLKKFPIDSSEDKVVSDLCSKAVEEEYGAPLNKLSNLEHEHASGFDRGFKKAFKVLGFTLID